MLAHLPYSWLVSQAMTLSQHFAEWRANIWHKSTPMWKASQGLSHWEIHADPTSKITLDDIKEAFLVKSGTLSISWGRNLFTSTSRIFSNTNVNCTWSNHWHNHYARSLLHTASWIIDLPSKLDTSQLIPISRLSLLLSRLWHYLVQLQIINHSDRHFKFPNCRRNIKATRVRSEDCISLIHSMITWTLPNVFTIETRTISIYWGVE
jgi:hypothetical protein